MTRYALFLRGINVGGVKVPMPELREVLLGLGCQDFRTWLNTGNVMLDDERDVVTLKSVVEKALTSAFGYDAHVLVRPASELAALVSSWPFDADPGFHRYVVFGGALAYESAQAALSEAEDPGREAVTKTSGEAGAAIGDDLMWRCPKGATTTSSAAKVLAKKSLKPFITTRNLNTVEKML